MNHVTFLFLNFNCTHIFVALHNILSGNFNTARKKLLDKAKKSLYGLFRKIQNISIPIDLQLKLFDSLVTPILLYSIYRHLIIPHKA
jgi:hypothetical protein